MKKTYKKPEILMCEIQAAQMIAQSGLDTKKSQGTAETSGNLGKDRDNSFEGGMGSLW